MANGVITISDSSFDEEIAAADKPVLVDFWAEWCGPCKKIAPIVEEIASEESGRLLVGKVNVDDNPAIQRRFEVMSIPTLMLFKDGEVVARFVGAKGKRQILEDLEPYL